MKSLISMKMKFYTSVAVIFFLFLVALNAIESPSQTSDDFSKILPLTTNSNNTQTNSNIVQSPSPKIGAEQTNKTNLTDQIPSQPISVLNSPSNEKVEVSHLDKKSRYYLLKVKIEKEEQIRTLMKKEEIAPSEEIRRQLLHEYYNKLSDRMKQEDPSLSEWIDTMHAAYLRRLEQLRISPTIPIVNPGISDRTTSTNN